jgi:hypothetical protein
MRVEKSPLVCFLTMCTSPTSEYTQTKPLRAVAPSITQLASGGQLAGEQQPRRLIEFEKHARARNCLHAPLPP